jgi:hypothetical protein
MPTNEERFEISAEENEKVVVKTKLALRSNQFHGDEEINLRLKANR